MNTKWLWNLIHICNIPITQVKKFSGIQKSQQSNDIFQSVSGLIIENSIFPKVYNKRKVVEKVWEFHKRAVLLTDVFECLYNVVFWAKLPTSVNFLLEVHFHGCVTPFSDLLVKHHLPFHPKYPKKCEKSVSLQPFQAKSKFVLEHSEVWTRVKTKTISSEQCGIVRFRTSVFFLWLC